MDAGCDMTRGSLNHAGWTARKQSQKGSGMQGWEHTKCFHEIIRNAPWGLGLESDIFHSACFLTRFHLSQAQVRASFKAPFQGMLTNALDICNG